MLHHPDFQLNEAVGVEAVVLSHAAVADFMATEIQLAKRTQGSDFGITDCVLLQNVDQAPKRQTGRRCLQALIPSHICIWSCLNHHLAICYQSRALNCEVTYLWSSKSCFVTGWEQSEGSSFLVLLIILGLWSKHTCKLDIISIFSKNTDLQRQWQKRTTWLTQEYYPAT